MPKNFYITTTLPYVNASPHIGHAVEFVQSDVLARHWRLQGHDVFFNTGVDEHGQKIFEAAQKEGGDVQKYVDHYAQEFKTLGESLNLSYDAFVRTTSKSHIQAAQEIWKRCEAKGDIYKKAYEGLYCVGCEKFLTQKEIVDGVCHIHKKEPELLKEENYFFKFSKYQEKLLVYLENKNSTLPDWRREEAVAFVKEGLEDFSISREKNRLAWGIPVPEDDTQVMYVWFDALTSYISTLGWPHDAEGNFKKFWLEGHVVQMAGKDQIRFQSLMWQAMLMSVDIKNTDQVFYHGFINSGGQKMSKSLGNVINPYELIQKYGTDATRYLLLRHVHATEDTDVTWEKLDEWYTAGLVNGIGNLVSRILKMSESYGVTLRSNPDPFVFNSLGEYKFNTFVDELWGKVQELDEYIQINEPFKKIKNNETEAKGDVQHLLQTLYAIAVTLEIVMPNTARLIVKAIKENKKPENLFPRLS